MISPWLMPLASLFPLLLAGCAAHRRLKEHILLLLPLAALPALAAGLLLPDGASITLPNALLEASWTMDPTGRLFQLFTASGWLFAGLYAVFYFKTDPHKGRFAVPFLIAMSGNFLLPTTSDAVTFYSGFAVMSFASWGLVVHSGTEEARRAGRIYLALVVLGELMVFPGLVKGVLWAETADLAAIRTHWALDPDPRLQIFLIFFGFAIKAGLFPLHFWLPLAHPVAPTPASAVLSGCMVKAGLLAWIRLIPLGEFPMPVLGHTAAGLAACGLILSLLCGLTQTNPKALLAYSSVSKMSLIVLLLAPAMLEPALTAPALAAALLYAGFHSLHKTALFLGSTLTAKLGSRAQLPLLLLCASFAGLPWLSGALLKVPIKALHDHIAFPGANLYLNLFNLAAFLTLLLMARFFMLTRPAANPAAPKPSRGLALTWGLATLTALAMPALLIPLNLLPATDTVYTPVKPWLDPVFALALVTLILYSAIRPRLPRPVPPGDLFHILPRLPCGSLNRLQTAIQHMESHFSRPAGGLIYLSLILLFLLLIRQ
ncbi:MAG: NADH/ubiquinone/plastoquinone (complex I) [Verrucomicrobia bacterium]|nr:NADH/ubiquinone/plastoquinone (complex I) [Verrucomicrobiota bacterium]